MDWASVGVQAIIALVPVVTVIFVYLVRKGIPALPGWALPLLAMALGTAESFLLAYAGGPDIPVLIAAIAGAAATWLHEIIKEFNRPPV